MKLRQKYQYYKNFIDLVLKYGLGHYGFLILNEVGDDHNITKYNNLYEYDKERFDYQRQYNDFFTIKDYTEPYINDDWIRFVYKRKLWYGFLTSFKNYIIQQIDLIISEYLSMVIPSNLNFSLIPSECSKFYEFKVKETCFHMRDLWKEDNLRFYAEQYLNVRFWKIYRKICKRNAIFIPKGSAFVDINDKDKYNPMMTFIFFDIYSLKRTKPKQMISQINSGKDSFFNANILEGFVYHYAEYMLKFLSYKFDLKYIPPEYFAKLIRI